MRSVADSGAPDDPHGGPERTVALATLGGAWVLLTIAIVPGGTFGLVPLAAAMLAWAAVAVVTLTPATRHLPATVTGVALRCEAIAHRIDGRARSAPWLVSLAALLGVVAAFVASGGTTGARGWLVAAAVVAAASPWLPGYRAAWWSGVTLLAAVGTQASIEAHTPSGNDVWYVVQGGTDALLRGANPFTQCWPGNPDPVTDCVYPYLPVTSIVLAPARLLAGDIRYGYLAAIAIASFAIMRLQGGRFGVALAFLIMPSGLVLADRAWTEPLLLAGLAVMVWATVRRVPVAAVLGFALAVASKQHMLLVVPLAMAWPAFGPRKSIVAVALAAASTIPWVLADGPAFVQNVIVFLLELPPRPDSLSLHALALAAGVSIPFIVSVGVTGLALIAAMLRAPRSAYGFVVATAFVLFTFNLVNKQSFFNYHALVADLLVLAIAVGWSTGLGHRAAAAHRRPRVASRSV